MWGGTSLMGKALKAGQSWPQRATFASFIESLNLFRELTFSCMIDDPAQILKDVIENFRCHVVAGAFCPPSLWAGGEKVFSIHFPFWNHRSLSNNIENRNMEISYLNPFKSTVLYNRHLHKWFDTCDKRCNPKFERNKDQYGGSSFDEVLQCFLFSFLVRLSCHRWSDSTKSL